MEYNVIEINGTECGSYFEKINQHKIKLFRTKYTGYEVNDI